MNLLWPELDTEAVANHLHRTLYFARRALEPTPPPLSRHLRLRGERLALEVAGDLVGAYQDGVWLVELAALSDGKLVPQAVARTMSVREQPGRPLIDTLTEALHKKAALLV